MSLEYIRENYGVPAYKGRRVKYEHEDFEGTIIGSAGCYLKVQFDDTPTFCHLHPTWKITYLASNQGGA